MNKCCSTDLQRFSVDIKLQAQWFSRSNLDYKFRYIVIENIIKETSYFTNNFLHAAYAHNCYSKTAFSLFLKYFARNLFYTGGLCFKVFLVFCKFLLFKSVEL